MNFLIGAAIALALLVGSAFAQSNVQNNQSRGPAILQVNLGSGDVQSFNDSRSRRPLAPRAHRAADPYQHDQFVVNDWRQHNLTAPPRGYHWVGNDSNKYLLVSIATGIVLDECNQSDHRKQPQ